MSGFFDRDQETPGDIRNVKILEGEFIDKAFIPDSGIVIDSTLQGDLLALTNRRIIAFLDQGDHSETTLVPISELYGISLSFHSRGFRDLVHGFFMTLLGIAGYFIAGYVVSNILIGLIFGVSGVVLGVLYISRFVYWESNGTIVFHGSGSVVVKFPFRNKHAEKDVCVLADRFFQLKGIATNLSYHTTEV